MTHVLTRPTPQRKQRPESVHTRASAAPNPQRRSVAFLVFVLGILTAVGPLATDLYLPAFPEIVSDLGASQAQVQLTLTAIMVGIALGQLLIGPLSDAMGRRLPLFVGSSVFALTSFLCVIAPDAETLIVLRFLQGLSGAAGAVVSRAIVRDLFTGERAARFFSRLILIVGLAPMLGPILGAQLLLVGPWQLSFVVLGVAGLASAGLVAFVLPESLPAGQRQPLRLAAAGHVFLSLLRDSRFVVPALTLALSFAMTFTYVASFSFVAQSELGATPQQYSLIFAVNTIGMVLGTQVNAALVNRIPMSRLLLGGLLGALVSVVALVAITLYGGGLLSVSVALLAMMTSTGFISPNATTIALSSQPQTRAGSASALLGSVQFAVGGGLSALAGLTTTGEATLASMTVIMFMTIIAATALLGHGLLRARRLALS